MKYAELFKYADYDPSLIDSPFLQAGVLGGLGYFGTNALYDRIAKTKQKEQELLAIEDPVQRAEAIAEFRAEQAKKKKLWSAGIGAALATLPMVTNYGTLKEGWQKGERLGEHSTSMDRMLGRIAGLGVAGIGGKKAVANMTHDDDMRQLRMNQFAKYGSEKSYIYDFLEKTADAYNDAFFGKDFKLPEMRPLSTNGFQDIPVRSSIGIIQTPNNAQIMGQGVADKITDGLYNASNGMGAGLISTSDFIKGLTRAGVGGLVGRAIGSTLGTMFAFPPQVKSKLKTYGAFGGAIANLGIIQ